MKIHDFLHDVPYSLRYQRIYFNCQVKLIPAEDHGFSKDIKGAARTVADFFKQQLI
ncbi:hypothetical protein [Selenomonas ruminantium]|uniref:hypothetical protein n=1 Tax=Selenomonas ruminantium TaxID=971 RepID=UPI001C409365|nr:hypothetical protein [Selenomonas ruminantium]